MRRKIFAANILPGIELFQEKKPKLFLLKNIFTDCRKMPTPIHCPLSVITQTDL